MDQYQSSYTRWTWIVALLLTLALVWLLAQGKGHTSCCHHTNETASTDVETISADTPAATVVTEAFSFSASANGFSSTGDASTAPWTNNLDALNTLLGDSLKAEGDDIAITLTGAMRTEVEKQQKTLDAQAFFGAGVSINNQISVSDEPVNMAPPLAKIFFDSGYHRLPPDSASVLAPTIAFLQNNPDKKTVISGFHDATGDFASNQKLAKKRAQAVYDALITAGIAADNIEMRKPVSTDGGGDLKEARRVEVAVE